MSTAPTLLILTIEELSDLLKVPKKTLYNWRSAGGGPRAMKVGNTLRFQMTDVIEWMDQNSREAA